MAWFWFCALLFVMLKGNGAVLTEGETDLWQNGSLQGWMFSVMPNGEVRFRSDHLFNITELTVCLRVMTEDMQYEKASYNLHFTSGNVTEHRVSVHRNSYDYDLQVDSSGVRFDAYAMVPSFGQRWPWRNRCFTWESSSGMAQLWFDGKMSIRKGITRGQVLSGQAEFFLSSFEGQVSDIYVWDKALSAQNLYNYLYYNYGFPYGSILDWSQIQYMTSGYVVMEPTYNKPGVVQPITHKKQKKRRGLRKLQRDNTLL